VTAAHPAWPKGWYRLGRALAAAQRWGPAAAALERATALDPSGAADAAAPLTIARRQAARAAERRTAQAAIARRHAAWAARTAREAAGRATLLGQLEQGMAAHAWEVEDWEWRPTWLPPSLAAAAASAPGGSTAPADMQPSPLRPRAFKSDAANRHLLAGLSRALADLEAPSRAAALARDEALMGWYWRSLRGALRCAGGCAGGGAASGPMGCGAAVAAAAVVGAQGGAASAAINGGSHVLVLGGGAGGVLALLAAAAGAARVTVVERTPLGLAAARGLVAANAAVLEAAGCELYLAPAPLACCCAPGWEPRGDDPVERGAAHDGTAGSSCSSSGGGVGEEAGAIRAAPTPAPRAAHAGTGPAAPHVIEGPPADVVVTDLAAEPG
jgi:hypothetical protein